MGTEMESPCVALDIGCNSGDLTVAIHNHLTLSKGGSHRELHILGVDVDPELINVARRDHSKAGVKSDRGSVTFEPLDLTASPADVDRRLAKYVDRVSGDGKNRVCGGQKFDVVFCFSVTMWIHLNHGDRGLAQFFATLVVHKVPGGGAATVEMLPDRLKTD